MDFLDSFWVFVLVGFCAQIIDGCLGMAYGVISTSFLTALGVPILNASASIHFSEIFTTFTSGLSHLKFKNVDHNLLKKLLIPGVIGGISGACVLTQIDGNLLKPFVAVYLMILGIRILLKAFHNIKIKNVMGKIMPLGFIGGFFDAVGGGGWGPIVTSTLIARGNCPKKTIGSVNVAEFFVTLAQSTTFFVIIGMGYWPIMFGLLLGGCLAAPLGAYLCQKINIKVLLIAVACLILVTNSYTLFNFTKNWMTFYE